MKPHLPNSLRALLLCVGLTVCSASAETTSSDNNSVPREYANESYDYSGQSQHLAITTEDIQDYNNVSLIENQYQSASSNYDENGGVFFVKGSLQIEQNNSVSVLNNVLNATRNSGGAIYVNSFGSLDLKDNITLNFTNNLVTTHRAGIGESDGGAIFASTSASVNVEGDSNVTFYENRVECTTNGESTTQGGAIGVSGGSAIFSQCENIDFTGNSAESISTARNYDKSHSYGGAIYAGLSDEVRFSDNTSVTFSKNTVSCDSSVYWSFSQGGAIYAGNINFCGNTAVNFSENAAKSDESACESFGGAICGPSDTRSKLSFSQNDSVTFNNNAVESASYAGGGALVRGGSSDFSQNGSILFRKNTVCGGISALGGAVELSGNMSFCKNNSVTFCDNTVQCSGSSNSAKGGALYERFCGTLNFQGNNAVLFQRNAEINGDSYRLRSIYINGEGTFLNLSANEGHDITFLDSVYANNFTTVSLNTEGAAGSIIFSGETTTDDLQEVIDAATGWTSQNEVVSRRIATDEEITNSRTSELTGAVTLYGGKLIVEGKAILNLSGSLTVEGGNITVATGAQLNLAKADITMPSLTLGGGTVTLGTETDHAATLTTTALTVTADSTLNGNLVMTGGTLTFAKDATLTMGCSVTIGSDVVVVLDDEVISALASGTQTSLTLFTSTEDINIGQVTVQNTKGEAAPSNVKLEAKGGTIIATPEPATATLSLLALAGLISRRRRH